MKLLLAFAIVAIAFSAKAETDPCANKTDRLEVSQRAERSDQQVVYLYHQWKAAPRTIKTKLALQEFATRWRSVSDCKRSLVQDRTRRFGDDLVAKVRSKEALVRWAESKSGRATVAYDTESSEKTVRPVSAKPPKETKSD